MNLATVKLTEKQENCPYCHGRKSLVNVPGLSMQIHEQSTNGNFQVSYDCSNKDMTDNGIIVGDDDGYCFGGWNVKANYCPMCGRPLNK